MPNPQPPPAQHPDSPPWNPRVKIAVGVLVLILVGLALYMFRAVFVPLIIGALIAYVLTPVVNALVENNRVSKGAATALVFVAVLGVVVPLGIAAGRVVVEEGLVMISSQLISYIRELDAMSANTITFFGFEFAVGDLTSEITSALIDLVKTSATSTLGLALNAARTLVFFVFTMVIGFYLTRDGERVKDALLRLAPPDYQLDTARLMGEVDAVWSAFLRGQVILSLTVTAILTLLSAVLGLPQPLMLGIWGGLLEFLPSIGNMIWGGTVVLIALLEGSTYLPFPPVVFATIVFVVYVAFAQIDINYLIPTIIGGQVRLHPMVVLLGVIIGLSVGGVLGVALAAPTIASLRIVGRYLYAKLFDLDPFPPPEPVPAGAVAHRIGRGPVRFILPRRSPSPADAEESTPSLD